VGEKGKTSPFLLSKRSLKPGYLHADVTIT